MTTPRLPLLGLSLLLAALLMGNGCAGGGGGDAVTSTEVARASAPKRGGGSFKRVANADAPQRNPSEHLIYNGNLTLEAEDKENVTTLADEAVQLIERAGGYVKEDRRELYTAHLALRVPSRNFRPAMDSLEQLSGEVKRKSVETEDVTEEFTDLEARLKSRRDELAQYRRLLERARGVEEMVAVQKQLSDVQEEIERMEGRLNYLSNQIAYSTIKLKINTPREVRRPGFFERVGDNLKSGWQAFLEFLLMLINLWPFVLLAILVIAWVRRSRKRGRKKKAEAAKSSGSGNPPADYGV